MEFKFERWALSEDRCRACVMTGGVLIKDAELAARFRRVQDAEDEVAVGSHLLLPPCESEAVLDYIREKHGRPCPRVELLPENSGAASLVGTLQSDHLAHAFGPMFEAFAEAEGLDPEGRIDLLRRVMAACQDDKIVELRRQAHERAVEAAKQR